MLGNYKNVLYELIMNEDEENGEVSENHIVTVSYTHLDVYKRQP